MSRAREFALQCWQVVRLVPMWLVILPIRAYQLCVSPFLGRNCRFHPSCSQYFILAVQKHGVIWGSARGVWRILKCHPFHPGGYDPP